MIKHQKHAKLTRPKLGHFGRNEWAILGTPCGNIKKLAFQLIEHLSKELKIAYVDADHKSADDEELNGKDQHTALAYGGSLEYTDKITFSRFDYLHGFNDYQQKMLYNGEDAVLVNGNHFLAKNQIAVIDPKKPLEKKLAKLTNVEMIVFQEGVNKVPAYLSEHLKDRDGIEYFRIDEVEKIAESIRNRMFVPPLHALVLAGGKSTRMKRDKGLLNYHGKAQREFAYDLLKHKLGIPETFISCRADQESELTDAGFSVISDKFLGLGPFGGILSAFQQNPDAAWMVIACDLPFLSEKSLGHLIEHRNVSKIATTFQSPVNEFPEPLITIWEPRSYQWLLHFLSLGYSCPRKVLINSDIELLNAPIPKELANINLPEEYEEVMMEFRGEKREVR